MCDGFQTNLCEMATIQIKSHLFIIFLSILKTIYSTFELVSRSQSEPDRSIEIILRRKVIKKRNTLCHDAAYTSRLSLWTMECPVNLLNLSNATNAHLALTSNIDRISLVYILGVIDWETITLCHKSFLKTQKHLK